MALNYKPLWIQLAKKGLKKTDVIAMAGLTTNVMAQMGKDKPIIFKNLERMRKALSCTPNNMILLVLKIHLKKRFKIKRGYIKIQKNII